MPTLQAWIEQISRLRGWHLKGSKKFQLSRGRRDEALDGLALELGGHGSLK